MDGLLTESGRSFDGKLAVLQKVDGPSISVRSRVKWTVSNIEWFVGEVGRPKGETFFVKHHISSYIKGNFDEFKYAIT